MIHDVSNTNTKYFVNMLVLEKSVSQLSFCFPKCYANEKKPENRNILSEPFCVSHPSSDQVSFT